MVNILKIDLLQSLSCPVLSVTFCLPLFPLISLTCLCVVLLSWRCLSFGYSCRCRVLCRCVSSSRDACIVGKFDILSHTHCHTTIFKQHSHHENITTIGIRTTQRKLIRTRQSKNGQIESFSVSYKVKTWFLLDYFLERLCVLETRKLTDRWCYWLFDTAYALPRPRPSWSTWETKNNQTERDWKKRTKKIESWVCKSWVHFPFWLTNHG